MKKIILLFFILIGCRDKTEFTPFKSPLIFTFIVLDGQIDVIKEPGKEEVVGKITPDMLIESDGVLKIVPRDKTKNAFELVSVVCPTEWKCDKDRGYILRHHIFVTEEELKKPLDEFYPTFLVPKEKYNKMLPTIKWLNNQGAFPEEGLDEQAINFWLGANKDNPESILKIHAFLFAIKEQKLDEHFEDLAKKNLPFGKIYNALVVEKTELEYKPKLISDSLYKSFSKIADEKRESTAKNFFLQDKSWSDLAREFNEMKDMPYVPDKIFMKVLESGLYKLEGLSSVQYVGFTKDKSIQPARWHLEIKMGEGLFLTEEVNGKKTEPYLVNKIVAEYAYDKDGLIFKISNEIGDLTLIPIEISAAFDVGKKIKQMIADLPKTHTEIFKSYNIKKTMQLSAMKFGKGGLNRKSGYYEYEIDNINMIFDFFKFGVSANSDEIKGEFSSSGIQIIQGSMIKSYTWYQRYNKATKVKSLHINITKEFCGRECFEEKESRDCFETGNVLDLSFSQEELESALPKFAFETNEDPCYFPFYK